jgi:ElaB/YqjD/DUF883 family membrane-anchored ribosome-binding protein
MDHESEVIRHQMEETRASLSDKLETLEEKVVGTVKEATQAVSETVENVKEAVQSTVSSVRESVSDTVETVKETFNLRRQFDQHPWAMFGGSVAVGFGVGWLLSGRRRSFRSTIPTSGIEHRWEGRTLEPQSFTAAPPPRRESWLQHLATSFGPELNKLKGLALGTLFGALRDVAVNLAPENLADQVRDVANSFTAKMGGEVVHGPVLPECRTESTRTA